MTQTLLRPDEDPLAPFAPSEVDLFDARKAAHLLRRAGFGSPFEEIERAMVNGVEKTVDRLLGKT